MASIFGNILLNGQTKGFSTPEEMIKILIDNNCLDEFLKMVEIVKLEESECQKKLG
jgi:hypothetical protein